MGHEKCMIELLHSDLWKLGAAIVTIFPDNHHNRMTDRQSRNDCTCFYADNCWMPDEQINLNIAKYLCNTHICETYGWKFVHVRKILYFCH